MHLRSRENRLRSAWIGFAIASYVLFAGAPSIAALPAQTSASQRTALPSAPIQPPLDVDRDPIPSPDAAPPPRPANTNEPPPPLGSIGRGAGGKYTLRED